MTQAADDDFDFGNWLANLTPHVDAPITYWRSASGEPITAIGDFGLPLSTVPDRLYGARLTADGDAV
jgi:hypothetical protein